MTKVINFPSEKPLGKLFLGKSQNGEIKWVLLGLAQGSVEINAAEKLYFVVDDKTSLTDLPDLQGENETFLASLSGLQNDILAGISFKSATDLTISYISHLTSLRYLDLTLSKVTHLGIDCLKPLQNLEILRLDACWKIQDDALEKLVYFSSLTELGLTETKISDNGLRFLTQLPFLEKIVIGGTPITDLGVRILATQSRVKKYYLNGCNVTSDSLEVFSKVVDLEILDLSYTKIKAANWKLFGFLQNLQFLALDGLEVSKVAFDVLLTLPKLEELSLKNITFEGNFYQHLRHFTNLKKIDLRSNSLEDSEINLLKTWLPNCEILA